MYRALSGLIVMMCALQAAIAGPTAVFTAHTPDVDLSYVVYGKSDGNAPPLLVVNGGPGFDHTYMVGTDVWGRLAERRAVVFYDQRGTGQSKLNKPTVKHTIDAYIADLDAVRAALGAAKIDLMGDSYGGFVSIAYAAAHPEHVASLTLVDSMDADWEKTLYIFSQVFPDRVPQNMGDPDWDRMLQSSEGLHSYMEMLFYDRQNFERFMSLMPPNAGINFPVYHAVNVEQAGVKLRPQLKHFRFPCLIINGRFDANVAPATAWRTSQAIAGARLVIFEKSGHLPFYEEPDRFVAVVSEFLAR
jgi:proline iminopeptidase